MATPTDRGVMRAIALGHVVVALLLSIGSFVVPKVVAMSLQREVEVAVYGGAIALFFQLVAVGFAAYAKARRVVWGALGGSVLTATLTFVALWRMVAI
jgi:hypothetical protein